MSEAALYAATPLNNDGSLDWQEAAEICKTALDDCVKNGYALFKMKPASGNENLISHCSYDFLFQKTPDAAGSNEKETILGLTQCKVWQYNTARVTRAPAHAPRRSLSIATRLLTASSLSSDTPTLTIFSPSSTQRLHSMMRRTPMPTATPV